MKYAQLETHLAGLKQREVAFTFRRIESIIGAPLPRSARRHRAWWSNNPSNNVATRAWLNAGYETAEVDIGGERLVFRRIASQSRKREPEGEFPLYGRFRDKITVHAGTDLCEPTGADWEAENQ